MKGPRDEALVKVRKLLALAAPPNHESNEARNALVSAAAIMRDHGLEPGGDLEELDRLRADVERLRSERSGIVATANEKIRDANAKTKRANEDAAELSRLRIEVDTLRMENDRLGRERVESRPSRPWQPMADPVVTPYQDPVRIRRDGFDRLRHAFGGHAPFNRRDAQSQFLCGLCGDRPCACRR